MNDGVAILLIGAGIGLVCFLTGWKVAQSASSKSLDDNALPISSPKMSAPMSANPVRRLRRVLSEPEIARIERTQVLNGTRHRLEPDNDPGEGFYRAADDRF